MTKEETIKILAILKAAYPNSYKKMTKEEANGTVFIWSVQFAKIPADVVMLAVNKLISTSTFPPAISEVKEKIRNLYWEAWELLEQNKRHKYLSAEQEAFYQKVMDVTEAMRCSNKPEPTLYELTSGGTYPLLTGGTGQ